MMLAFHSDILDDLKRNIPYKGVGNAGHPVAVELELELELVELAWSFRGSSICSDILEV